MVCRNNYLSINEIELAAAAVRLKPFRSCSVYSIKMLLVNELYNSFRFVCALINYIEFNREETTPQQTDDVCIIQAPIL